MVPFLKNETNLSQRMCEFSYIFFFKFELIHHCENKKQQQQKKQRFNYNWFATKLNVPFEFINNNPALDQISAIKMNLRCCSFVVVVLGNWHGASEWNGWMHTEKKNNSDWKIDHVLWMCWLWCMHFALTLPAVGWYVWCCTVIGISWTLGAAGAPYCSSWIARYVSLFDGSNTTVFLYLLCDLRFTILFGLVHV